MQSTSNKTSLSCAGRTRHAHSNICLIGAAFRATVIPMSDEITELPEAKIYVPDSFTWTSDKKLMTRKPN